MGAGKSVGKKVLILSGSARAGGNSDRLCDRFADGAKDAGCRVEKIRVSERNIKPCIGCGACNATKKCIYDDDMKGILERMIDADVIVLASPVYFYTINGQMKTLIDRTVPRYTDIKDKNFYFILAAADTEQKNMERSFECFRGFLDCLDGAREKGVLCALGVWKTGEVEGTKAMDDAYALGHGIK